MTELELKVDLVMEAAGNDDSLYFENFEALMDPYSFERLFTIHY